MLNNLLITTGIYEPDIGGPASYARAIAPRLAAEGVRVTVVTYSSARHYAPDQQSLIKVIRIWRKLPKLLRHYLYFFNVLRQTRRADGVLALSAMNAGLATMIACRLFKKKYIVRVVGDYAWETAMNKGKTGLLIDEFQKSKKSGRIRWLHNIQTRVCRNADKIIVPSQYLAGIVRGWGIDPQKIYVIYNGVSFVSSALKQEEARSHLGIHGNIILSVGRLVPWKGFRMLVKIMPQLLAINQFARLVIVGDGPDQRALEMMIHNMGLDKKVFLVGRKSQEQLAVYLAAADMFLLNTGYEGFSHQLVEALTAAVPVITTRVGGNPEIIHQGRNGFLINFNDEFNLIEAIKTLWQTPHLREQFIEQGRLIIKDFNVDQMYYASKRLLESLIQRRS